MRLSMWKLCVPWRWHSRCDPPPLPRCPQPHPSPPSLPRPRPRPRPSRPSRPHPQGGYAEARALIERAGPVLSPDQPLPLDLAVKSGGWCVERVESGERG